MRRAAFGACLLSALALAAAASAGGQTVRTVMRGTCTQANRLDANGALLSLTLTCTASAACTCEGSTKLAYRSEAHLRGNGAPGRESGSLVASGPTGSVTLLFIGTRTALGQGSGTWTLGQVTGFHGVRLATRGSYTTQTKTLQSVTGTMNTVVSVTGSYGCWNCAG